MKKRLLLLLFMDRDDEVTVSLDVWAAPSHVHAKQFDNEMLRR